MSKEAVNQMMQAAGNDEELQTLLTEAGSFAEVVKIGADRGYIFTEEELQMSVAERGIAVNDTSASPPEGDELSDAELEAVAGGWFDGWRVSFRWGGW